MTGTAHGTGHIGGAHVNRRLSDRRFELHERDNRNPHYDTGIVTLKIIVEKHPDGYVAYPLGLKGVVVGQGGTYMAALEDVTSAVAFHIHTFGDESIADDSPVIEAFVAEAAVAI